jgi:hypothetical protein
MSKTYGVAGKLKSGQDFFSFSTFAVDKYVQNPWEIELSVVTPAQIVSRRFFALRNFP